jgi:hypothetical protein
VLVDALPGESATKTAIRDALGDERLAELARAPREGHGPWSHTDLLIGSAITHLRWLIYAVYAAQGGKPNRPEPYPMPGATPARQRKALTPEGHAYLRQLREQHARLHGGQDADRSEPEGA